MTKRRPDAYDRREVGDPSSPVCSLCGQANRKQFAKIMLCPRCDLMAINQMRSARP